MSKYSNRVAAIGVMSAIALGTFSAVPAYAKSAKIQKQGTCSKGSHWKLAVSHDAGRIQTEFEVDSNRVGQKWNVVITDNGVRVLSGNAYHEGTERIIHGRPSACEPSRPRPHRRKREGGQVRRDVRRSRRDLTHLMAFEERRRDTDLPPLFMARLDPLEHDDQA